MVKAKEECRGVSRAERREHAAGFEKDVDGNYTTKTLRNETAGAYLKLKAALSENGPLTCE